ncbi:MAG TPA: STAS domain-containing protein [Gaiellaceae bacterium]|nr:STAS domain-containing protein [Gaiellaceae bacterium]
MERSELRIERGEPGTAIVVLTGEHDVTIAAPLSDALDELVDADVAIVVDLTRAQLLDSTLVAILLRTRREARERGVPFGVVADDTTGPAVLRLLGATGLVRDLPGVRER